MNSAVDASSSNTAIGAPPEMDSQETSDATNVVPRPNIFNQVTRVATPQDVPDERDEDGGIDPAWFDRTPAGALASNKSSKASGSADRWTPTSPVDQAPASSSAAADLTRETAAADLTRETEAPKSPAESTGSSGETQVSAPEETASSTIPDMTDSAILEPLSEEMPPATPPPVPAQDVPPVWSPSGNGVQPSTTAPTMPPSPDAFVPPAPYNGAAGGASQVPWPHPAAAGPYGAPVADPFAPPAVGQPQTPEIAAAPPAYDAGPPPVSMDCYGRPAADAGPPAVSIGPDAPSTANVGAVLAGPENVTAHSAHAPMPAPQAIPPRPPQAEPASQPASSDQPANSDQPASSTIPNFGAVPGVSAAPRHLHGQLPDDEEKKPVNTETLAWLQPESSSTAGGASGVLTSANADPAQEQPEVQAAAPIAGTVELGSEAVSPTDGFSEPMPSQASGPWSTQEETDLERAFFAEGDAEYNGGSEVEPAVSGAQQPPVAPQPGNGAPEVGWTEQVPAPWSGHGAVSGMPPGVGRPSSDPNLQLPVPAASQASDVQVTFQEPVAAASEPEHAEPSQVEPSALPAENMAVAAEFSNAQEPAVAGQYGQAPDPSWQSSVGHVAEPTPVVGNEPPPVHGEVNVAPPAEPEAGHSVGQEQQVHAAPARFGEVVVVFGCRGGAGATTIATNIAGQMASTGKEVCLLDLDLQLGDVMVALDADSGEGATVATLAREATTLDEAVLKRRLTRHASGLYLISQGGKLEEIDSTLPSMLPGLISRLRGFFDTVVIDGVRDFGEWALAALDVADVITLVVTQDVASVRRACRVIEVCRKLGYSDSKLRIVLNRHHRRSRIRVEEVERALKMSVHARVANDYRTATAAQNDGRLLADVGKRRKISRDVRALGNFIAAEAAARHHVEVPA